MNISEMLMNVDEKELSTHMHAALARSPDALAVIKRVFLEYDDHVLPYAPEAFYANAGITDKNRVRNTVALDMAITSGMAWARQTPRAPSTPPAVNPGNAQAGETSRDMYRRAWDLQEAGDYEQAVNLYRKAIEAADANGIQSTDMFVNGSAAACNLADKYEHGLGVPQDYQQALAWYTKSAAKANCVAQYSLGMMHKNGLGVPASSAEAMGWFQQSARQGYADAAKELALLSAAALKERPVERSGFSAGTLVHTKEGLKPIEQIQVGDYVLSKPESGKGNTSYKKVLKTFEYEDKEVWYVEYILIGPALDPTDKRVGFLAVTGNHPLWIDGIYEMPKESGGMKVNSSGKGRSSGTGQDRYRGWLRADEIEPYMALLLPDGRHAWVTDVYQLFATRNPDHAWGGNYESIQEWNEGYIVDLSGPSPTTQLGHPRTSVKNDVQLLPDFSYPAFTRKVYNIEVDQNHTYFVGEMGVWVHTRNCKL
jgi:tetratricopeptide (TPR) repeat protein